MVGHFPIGSANPAVRWHPMNGSDLGWDKQEARLCAGGRLFAFGCQQLQVANLFPLQFISNNLEVSRRGRPECVET